MAWQFEDEENVRGLEDPTPFQRRLMGIDLSGTEEEESRAAAEAARINETDRRRGGIPASDNFTGDPSHPSLQRWVEHTREQLLNSMGVPREILNNMPADSVRGMGGPDLLMVDELPEGAYAAYREQIQELADTIVPGRVRVREGDPAPVDEDDELFRSMLRHVEEMDDETRCEFLSGMECNEEHRELAARLRERVPISPEYIAGRQLNYLNLVIEEWESLPLGSSDREQVFERMIACLGHMSTDTREACIQEMIRSHEAVRRGLGYRFRDRINGSESPLPFGYDEPVECAVCGQFECEHLGNITVSQVRPRGEGDPPPYEVNFSAGVGRSNLPEGYRLPGGERVDAPTESDVEVNELLRAGGEANSTRVFDITCTECGSISTLCLVGTVSVNGIGCTCGCTSMTVRLRQVDDIVH